MRARILSQAMFPEWERVHPLRVAEEVGFEPTTEGSTPGNRLAGGRTRPTMRLLQALVRQDRDLAEGVGFEPTRRLPA